MIGSLPSFRFSRSPGLTLIAFAGVLCLAYEVAQLVLNGDMSTIFGAGMVFVGLAVVTVILNDWRRGLYLLLGWILFEDFFRKYLGNNMAIFFAKDFLTIVLYISFVAARSERPARNFKPPFLIPLLVFFWFGVIQVFNPASTSIFYGILGMKVYFLYIPLVYVGYSLIGSEQELRRFFSYNSILVIIVAGLGIAQSILGPKFLNPSVLQDDIRDLSTLYRIAPLSGLVAYRPTSVFVSAGRFQNFMIVSWIMALGFGGYLLLRSRRGRNVAFLSVALTILAAMASGLPVIASVRAGASENIRHSENGFLLQDPHDAEELAGLTRRLFADRSPRHEMGNAAARTAAECSWQNNAERTKAFLEGAARSPAECC